MCVAVCVCVCVCVRVCMCGSGKALRRLHRRPASGFFFPWSGEGILDFVCACVCVSECV